MAAPDIATIQALRIDVALQITRSMRRRGLNQLTAAKVFGVPQPTLSKIVNGRVAERQRRIRFRIKLLRGFSRRLA